MGFLNNSGVFVGGRGRRAHAGPSMARLKVDLPLWIPFSRPLSLILIDLSFLAVARVSLRMIEGLFFLFFFSFLFWKMGLLQMKSFRR